MKKVKYSKALQTEGVPSNIAQFAKRRGVMPLVSKVAKWAKALNTAVIGGTAIGKGYSTLVLELGHYKSRVYVDIDDETISVNGKDVDNLKSFKQALELRESKNMKLTKTQLRKMIREELNGLNVSTNIKKVTSLVEGKKVFKINPPIGSTKYSISYHDGNKKHKDGSDFYDIETFKNKLDLEKAIKKYTSDGFVKESVNEGTITIQTKDGKLHHYPNFKKKEVVSFLTKNKMKQVFNKTDIKTNMDFYVVESVNEEFKHLISVDTPTQIVSKKVAAEIEALVKKGVRSKDIGLKMGFVGDQKAATDAFQKLKNQIYFKLDKR